jgi:flotillin
MDVKFGADTKIKGANRSFLLQKANFDSEVNSKNAEAQLAYELQSAILQQLIRKEEMEIEVIERKKEIDVQEKEILRKEKELISSVKLPAESEAYRVEMIATGKRTQTVAAAQAEAQKIKLIGGSEAYAIEAIGKAEAERMRMIADAYKQYGDAAVLSMTLEALPKIAAQVAAPLAKTDQIVLLGDSGNVVNVNQLVSQIPPAIQALTGVNLTGVLGKIPGAITQT